LLAACTASDNSQQNINYQEIAFAASMAENSELTTRAAQMIDDVDALKAQGGFGVYGCYTELHKYLDSNVNPDFMYNEHVTWNPSTSTWVYSPLKYWPNGEGETYSSIITGENPHFVSFMGYAPYRAEPEQCIFGFSQQEDLGNPWIDYRLHPDVSQQMDLLYAEPLLDQKKQETDERLLFRFRHALGCVGDRVTIGCCDGMKEALKDYVDKGQTISLQLTKVSIEYTLTEEGRLVLWNDVADQPNWKLIDDWTPTTTRTVEFTEGLPQVIVRNKDDMSGIEEITPWTGTDKGVFYIPMHHEDHLQMAIVSIEFVITIGVNAPQTFTAATRLKLNDERWISGYQPGKHLYINANICGDIGDFDISGELEDGLYMATENWVDAGTGEHEVYNW